MADGISDPEDKEDNRCFLSDRYWRFAIFEEIRGIFEEERREKDCGAVGAKILRPQHVIASIDQDILKKRNIPIPFCDHPVAFTKFANTNLAP